MFCCPLCQRPLFVQQRALCCAAGHSFDLAAQGYVNLLPPNRGGSRDPGDNAGMIRARTTFLESGGYAPLREALCETIGALCPSPSPAILDAGCGEGYYIDGLCAYLQALGREPALYGIDLSKHGVRHAARRCPEGRFAVASIFELPFSGHCLDLVYNVFSPLCPQEFHRVLRRGGHFVAVYPAVRHLYSLKEVLYEHPYENEEKSFELEGFSITGRRRLCYDFTAEGAQVLQSLFMMTPYYYKTPIEGAKRLAGLERLRTTADFWLVSYRKRGKL